MGKKKKDYSPIITFIGANIKQVAGSSTIVKYFDDELNTNLLYIECGLPQGGSNSHTPLGQYNDMYRMVSSVKGGGLNNHEKYKNINAVFSHVH